MKISWLHDSALFGPTKFDISDKIHTLNTMVDVVMLV